jgi:ribosomal-protein-alanine N-acetyltransferase
MLDLSAIFATFPTLETDRCLLRPLTPGDAADMLRLYSDPQVIRYLGKVPMVSLDEAAAKIESYHKLFQEQSAFVWAVTHRGDGQVMGTGLIWNINAAHFRAEIGYMLAPQWWGQGIMTEIMGILLSFAFETMRLHSLEAYIDPENGASRRVLEKAGFVQEAYYHEDFYNPVQKQFLDTAVLCLLEGGWRRQNGQSHV